MRLRVKAKAKAKATNQSNVSRERKTFESTKAGNKDLYFSWAKVLEKHSEDCTVDVELESGIKVPRVPVRSMEWTGSNSIVGFGERNLPPADSLVLIVFPYGTVDEGLVLCSTYTLYGKTHVEKWKEELLVTGKEEEKIKINEVGWKETYDNETGDLVIESPDTTDQMKLTIDRTGKSFKAEIGSKSVKLTNSKLIVVADTVELAGSTKSLVTHAELDTAIQTFIGILNTAFSTKLNGTGSAGTLTLNISSAEATKVKTS